MRKQQNGLRKLALYAWMAGGLSLLTYAGHELWAAKTADAALLMFHERRLALATDESPRRDSIQRKLPATGPPETSAWSAQRIAAYEPKAAKVPEAVLRIESLHLEVPIYEGATQWNLNQGAARIDGTPPFGAGGNTGVAGHRDGYFRALRKLRVGQTIEVETLRGSLRYRVTAIRVVSPQAVDVLRPAGVPMLTLVTCYPFYYVGPAPQRWIAHAEQFDAT